MDRFALIFACLLFIITIQTLGCGGASTSRRGARENGRTHSGSSFNNAVSERTQRETMKRQGSWSLDSDKVQDVSRYVEHASRKYAISEDLVYGIIWTESRFNPRAVSPVGARGLMQLMPRTASYLADCIDWRGRANAFDPDFNIHAGTYYIARLLKEFNGNERLALAAYNAGPTKVRRWLASSGLPKMSLEYAAIVQTSRGFFSTQKRPAVPSGTPAEPVVTDEALDRLGLTILIAGLSTEQFGLEREDDSSPFD
jgi:hypothetical protein